VSENDRLQCGRPSAAIAVEPSWRDRQGFNLGGLGVPGFHFLDFRAPGRCKSMGVSFDMHVLTGLVEGVQENPSLFYGGSCRLVEGGGPAPLSRHL
jgi:hypothetical protein